MLRFLQLPAHAVFVYARGTAVLLVVVERIAVLGYALCGAHEMLAPGVWLQIPRWLVLE